MSEKLVFKGEGLQAFKDGKSITIKSEKGVSLCGITPSFKGNNDDFARFVVDAFETYFWDTTYTENADLMKFFQHQPSKEDLEFDKIMNS